jgi:heparanase 1
MEMRRFLGGLCFLALLRLGGAAEAVVGVAGVDGRRAIAATDEDFVCATMDWWPPDKCDYGTCSWGLASLLNLVENFSLQILSKFFSPPPPPVKLIQTHTSFAFAGSLQQNLAQCHSR